MGADVMEDHQQLIDPVSDALDSASDTLRKARKRVRKTPELAPTMKSARGGSEDSGGESVTVLAEATTPDGVVLADEIDAKESQNAKLIDLPTLEALLFTTRHPLTPGRIGELIDVPSSKALRTAIAELNAVYESSGRSFRIEQVAGGYQMLTLPTYGAMLNELHRREIDSKLTRSALETLSIIAYKQPVLRAEVEAIRGVASGETIRTLMEKHLVKIAGRAEIAGRPILYGTTKRFLEVFGLNSLKELPKEDQTRPHPPHRSAEHRTASAAHTPEHSVEAETSDVVAESEKLAQEKVAETSGVGEVPVRQNRIQALDPAEAV